MSKQPPGALRAQQIIGLANIAAAAAMIASIAQDHGHDSQPPGVDHQAAFGH